MSKRRESSRSSRSSAADSDATTPYAYESEEELENSPARFKDSSEGRLPRSVVNRVPEKSQSSSSLDPTTSPTRRSRAGQSRLRSRSPVLSSQRDVFRQVRFEQVESQGEETLNSESESRRQYESTGIVEGARGPIRDIVNAVTENLQTHFQKLLDSKDKDVSSTLSELQQLKLQQQSESLISSAAQLSGEGAKAQYLAFAKIKSGLSAIRQKLNSHDTLGAIATISDIEKVVDVRLELVKRADSLPGGWPAGTIFEKKALGVTDEKSDKLWNQSVTELNSQSDSEGKVKSKARSRSQRRYQDDYQPFLGPARFGQAFHAAAYQAPAYQARPHR